MFYYRNLKKKKKGGTVLYNAITESKNSNGEISVLAIVLKTARGLDRTYNQYAQEAGIDVSTIHKLKKGTYKPTPSIIKKLTDANPRGGVTYAIMMQAAGFDISEENTNIEAKNYPDYQDDCIQTIYSSLIDSGIAFKKLTKDRDYLSIELIDQPIREWSFHFLYFPSDKPFPKYNDLFNSALVELFKNRPQPNSKKTIVVNTLNKTCMYTHLKYGNRLNAYQGNLSVLFYNPEQKTITDEICMAQSPANAENNTVHLIETDLLSPSMRKELHSFISSNNYAFPQTSDYSTSSYSIALNEDHLYAINAKLREHKENSDRPYMIKYFVDVNEDEQFSIAVDSMNSPIIEIIQEVKPE